MPGEVAALIAATSAAPKGRRSPSWPPAVPPAWSSPIRFMALSSSACTGSPLRLERGVDPADRFLTPLLEPEDLDVRPTGATEVAPARHAKAAERPQLRATVHRWPSPSGPAGKAWPGENVDEPSSPAFTTGPSTATLFSKLSVMFRSSLDTSIKPILIQGNRVRLNGLYYKEYLEDWIGEKAYEDHAVTKSR